jgi:hypothetical protein
MASISQPYLPSVFSVRAEETGGNDYSWPLMTRVASAEEERHKERHIAHRSKLP